ncbi:hypothetical protein CTKZ_07100 [Cellulomonas algicola]|uniref:Uncharacterized protein n=1 Tax=Cellulomonas algicola TaxID=2071633 RepID=A0A401UWX6_9CELL|nr:hypothetical protein CTKZ_07100 [Cellulomonas algicola]
MREAVREDVDGPEVRQQCELGRAGTPRRRGPGVDVVDRPARDELQRQVLGRQRVRRHVRDRAQQRPPLGVEHRVLVGLARRARHQVAAVRLRVARRRREAVAVEPLGPERVLVDASPASARRPAVATQPLRWQRLPAAPARRTR